MIAQQATVEVLTAEVRVLMVGARQITLSVAKQLDIVSGEKLEPFGRVALWPEPRRIVVIGSAGGVLALAILDRGPATRCSPDLISGYRCDDHDGQRTWEEHWFRQYDWQQGGVAELADWKRLSELPLIVLAGLR